MNAPTDISMKTDDVLRVELEVLKLKDKIAIIEDRLTPDIIA
jgi:hypothetical protein